MTLDTSVFYNESSNAFYLLNPITIIIFISPNFTLSKTKVCYQSYFKEIFYYFFKKGTMLCLFVSYPFVIGSHRSQKQYKAIDQNKAKSPK